MQISLIWNTKSAILFCLALAFGATSVSSAFAQSWKINSGRNIGSLLPTESHKLADGSTYLTGGSRQVVLTEDPTYPVTGQSMDCRWICRIPANGKDGACITLCGGVDKDGDLFSFRSLSFGAGNYEVGPGTGKYAKASGGGSFEPVTTADPNLSYVQWRGTLQLK
ncbi:MAG: hypothetical protein ABL878_06225 [Burkholderiales bacterium]